MPGRRTIFKLFTLGLLFFASSGNKAIEAREVTYYSIHIASFKELRNANSYVNSMREKGKIVFWKKADVPGKGIFYRVYLGRYSKRDDAVAFWEKLDADGEVGYFGVHRFTEDIELSTDEKTASFVKTLPEVRQRPVKKEERFIDNQNGTITDRATNLMWIKNGWRPDFFSALTWPEAVTKCKIFEYAGYSDWRLPTIEEWKSVIDSENKNPALIEPNPFENIIVHMPYWSVTESSFNIKQTGDMKHLPRAYVVMLYYGKFYHQGKDKRAFILPVRTMQ